MNNGISDWTPLAGDPMATETIEDWAEDILNRLDTMSTHQMFQIIRGMTDDELDSIREFIAKQEQPA